MSKKNKKNNKALAIVPEKTQKREIYRPQPVESIKCQFCGELLLRVYPYAYITNPTGQTQVWCMKCKHAKVK